MKATWQIEKGRIANNAPFFMSCLLFTENDVNRMRWPVSRSSPSARV
jgi:hypothetical protein